MKKLIAKSINTLSLVIVLAIATAAQTPTPEKSVQAIAAPKLASLATIPAGEKFTSAEGRFIISLPRDGSEFEKIVPTKDSPRETGGTYSWTLKEGVIVVNYSDDPDFLIKTAKDYADLEEGTKAGVTAFGGTVLSEKQIKLGEYRGYEILFETPDKVKGLSRVFIVGERKYSLFCLMYPDPPSNIEMATKALDSFELIAAKAAGVTKPVKKATKVTRKN